MRLGQLLLDEEAPQMAQLPCASDTQHRQLNQSVAHDLAIRGLGLITELCLAFLSSAVSVLFFHVRHVQ
jgi:hypothetical protein